MQFRHTLFFAIFLMMLSSCGFLYEYRSLHDIDGMEWQKSQIETFDFEITKNGTYDIEIIGRHLTGFPFKELNCSIGLKGETGELKVLVTIPMIGEDGMYLGEGGGDLWDFEFPALNNLLLSPGKYQVTLNHEMNKNPLPLLMEIGIQVVNVDE